MALLKIASTDGIIELSDGTRWRILPGQGSVSGRWLEGTDITVAPHPERGEGHAHLDNISAGEGVDAIPEA
ncbi:hypothetical protein VQ042_07820 [Aurantimonas sp. A2-1-M11]|uniref:hypothetical protein n=1 Tax=Aurantimonas sp. A2-1-M11 TaxID=3113712 RepID=UPI002F93F2BB